MKILVIEDEEKICTTIYDWFTRAGDSVDIENDGKSGLERALSGEYDCVILDLMLPTMDGFEVLNALQESGDETPVIILSARGDISDRVEGLTSGARDYLTKPFDFRELDARVRIISGKKSMGIKSAGTLTYEELVLNLNNSEIKNHTTGKNVRLSAKEFHLIEYFMNNPGQTLTKEQIFERIWGYDADIVYNNAEVYISFLRKKLKFIEASTTIETVRGIGYRLGKSQ
ncbi:MAG: response regulator transcription factor [Eubacterium sp.]|nr:response regulator transcription factor [Eubacterium sp.]